ncbi:hypothetical protein ACHAWU_000295 [Discostella pseudostelligera]|uniref:Glycosyltransferase family 92 protein n=1 Tax=Discostella pseudostelligera TaxID=259834 RepID=A0ABD3MAR2_9STRA
MADLPTGKIKYLPMGQRSIRPKYNRKDKSRLMLGTFMFALVVYQQYSSWWIMLLGSSMMMQTIDLGRTAPPTNQNDGNLLHNSFSALVPMSAVSEAEREVIPGTFNYGYSASTANDTSSSALVITGASISGDYHSSSSSSNSTLWIQIFVSARRFFETTAAMDACYSRDGKIQKEDVQPWNEVKNEKFLCRIGTREAYFELMPSNGVDGNTNELIQVWRCLLYDGGSNHANILSDYDFQAFHRPIVDDDGMALPIEVLHKSAGKDEYTTPVLVKMFLPVYEPTIGIHQIRSDLPADKPFLSQRHNITLCVVSHVNAISHWNEYIRYHTDIVGIDHIHMGLYTTFGEGQKDKTNQLYKVINRNFKHDIEEGTLLVSALWDDDIDIHCPDQDFPKMNFYQQCLYRAKSSSEFVATWDLDEYFLFHNLDDSKKQLNLPAFLRGIEHPQCQDWCFVTMKSSMAGFDENNTGTGLVAFEYLKRAKETSTTWQKSISRTRTVFLNSYHMPGACLPPGSRDLANTVAIEPSDDGECGFYIDEAIMVHARGMQYGEHELEDDEDTVQNELLDALLR